MIEPPETKDRERPHNPVDSARESHSGNPKHVYPKPLDTDALAKSPTGKAQDAALAETEGLLSPEAVREIGKGDARRFYLGIAAVVASATFAAFGIWYGFKSIPMLDTIIGSFGNMTTQDHQSAEKILPWFLAARSFIIIAAFGTSVAFFKGAQALSRSQFLEMGGSPRRDPHTLFQELAAALDPVVELLKEIVKLKK